MTIKKYNDWAEETKKLGITSADKLRAALPTLVEGLGYLKSISRFVKRTKEILDEISDQCALYASKHPDLLDGCEMSPIGVKSVDVRIGDDTYHGAFGFDGYRRLGPEKATQEFLEELPEGWTKSRLELSTSGINKAKPTLEELEKHELYQVPKNEWSLSADTAR